jgi:hypothetical protein
MQMYLKVGVRVEYKNGCNEIETGVITEMATRSSIGYTTHRLVIRPDGKGGLVYKNLGPKGDWVRGIP